MRGGVGGGRGKVVLLMLFLFPDRWIVISVHEYEPVGVADARQVGGGGWRGGVDGVRVFPPNSLALPELATMPSGPRQLYVAPCGHAAQRDSVSYSVRSASLAAC